MFYFSRQLHTRYAAPGRGGNEEKTTRPSHMFKPKLQKAPRRQPRPPPRPGLRRRRPVAGLHSWMAVAGSSRAGPPSRTPAVCNVGRDVGDDGGVDGGGAGRVRNVVCHNALSARRSRGRIRRSVDLVDDSNGIPGTGLVVGEGLGDVHGLSCPCAGWPAAVWVPGMPGSC